jgi:hypothetical protein
MKENDIVHIALENLLQNTGITAMWNENATDGLDGALYITIDDHTVELNVAVRNELRNHQLPALFEQAARNGNLMVVANHIFPKIKEALRQHDIAYLETNGNIWLKKNGILLWIDTQKPVQTKKSKGNRAFTKTGLKVVLHFLLHEQDINLPYRDIAAITEVGLGNINYIMTSLHEMGFLLKVGGKQYKLINQRQLLDKWMTAYAERLRPALNIGTFRFLKQDDFLNWKNLPLKENNTWWGGEPAGDILTNYLRPEILTLYTTETRNEIIKNYRLIPDENGKVKVFKKCWSTDEANSSTAPPLLVYTDLMNEGDRRCLEAAKKIYDEYLQDRL